MKSVSRDLELRRQWCRHLEQSDVVVIEPWVVSRMDELLLDVEVLGEGALVVPREVVLAQADLPRIEMVLLSFWGGHYVI